MILFLLLEQWNSCFHHNLIGRFLRFLSNFKNWIFYAFEHNFWSIQPNLINDPSKSKFILSLSNAKGLILWKFIEFEKIQFKERYFFLGHPVQNIFFFNHFLSTHHVFSESFEIFWIIILIHVEFMKVISRPPPFFV